MGSARAIRMMSWGFGVLSLAGCAGGAGRTASSPERGAAMPSTASDPGAGIGMFRISHFVLGTGQKSRRAHGEYLAMVSRKWANRPDGTSFREPYTLYWTPSTKIGIDEDLFALAQALQMKGFFRMPEAPTPDVDALKRIDSTTRVLSVEWNGKRKSVALETLSAPQRADFVELENAFWFAFNREKNPATTVEIEDLNSWGAKGARQNDRIKKVSPELEKLNKQPPAIPRGGAKDAFGREADWREIMRQAEETERKKR